jgi:metal-sulfur cluster biosynthetic enzyme
MPVNEEQIMQAMTNCFDPEIPVNIVELGLIYGVRLLPVEGEPEQTDVEVDMTLTSPGCPAHVGMGEDVRRKVGAVPGVREVKVNVVWTPQWTPQRLSPAARQKLGIEI